MLLVASVPLVLAMSVALWQSSNQTHALTIDIVQGYLEAGANDLSGFFSARKSEINAYAHSPLIKSMDFPSIRPLLIDELTRHGGTYENFILGTADGNFFKLESYIGAPIIVDGKRYGTLNYSSPEVHEQPFSTNELSLIQLLAQWIGNEMSRSRSEKVLSQFKTTLDQTMDCVFMFEPASLKFFYVNQGALEQVGYTENELMNMTPFDIKPEISEQALET